MMKKFVSILTAMVAALVLMTAVGARAANDEIQTVNAATAILNRVMAIPEMGIPVSVLTSAYALAIFPGVANLPAGAGGLPLGGRQGRGVLVARAPNGGWSKPVFVTLTAGEAGALGIGSNDYLLVFKNSRGVDALKGGSLVLGPTVHAAPGPVGIYGWPSAFAQNIADVYSYTTGPNAVEGVNLNSYSMQNDIKANEAFYAKRGVRPEEILASRGGLTMPEAAGDFSCMVAVYTQSSETC